MIDLSGAFRLRDDARAREVVSGHGGAADGVAYGLTEFELDAIRTARLLSNPGLLPDRVAPGLLPLQRAGLLQPGADIVIDAKSGISGAGKARDRSHAFFGEPRQRGRLRPVRPSPHAGNGAGARPAVTFVPHLVPLDRGILSSDLRAARARHDRGGGADGVRARLRRRRRSCG